MCQKLAFFSFCGGRNNKQWSLPELPLLGSAKSSALEPVQGPEVFGEGGSADLREEPWPSEGQTLLRNSKA